MNYKQNLSLRIVSTRKSRGYTQKVFSNKVGVSEPTINNYEKAKRIPNAEIMLKMAQVLECDPGWLLTGEGNGGTSQDSNRGFVFVPRYDLDPASGQNPIQSRQIVDHLAFKRDWVISELNTQPENLILVHATGDSMEPTIRPGDLLLVDRSEEKIKEDGIFLLHIQGGLFIRRVERRLEDGILLRGDNPATAGEPTIISGEKERQAMVGRVLWTGRRI